MKRPNESTYKIYIIIYNNVLLSLASGIYSLAPVWSSVFDKWDSLKQFQKELIIYDLGFSSKNPIAESHKWSTDYFDKESPRYCPECSWFSWSYTYVITGKDNLDKEVVRLKGEQFVDHWCNHHNGIKKKGRQNK